MVFSIANGDLVVDLKELKVVRKSQFFQVTVPSLHRTQKVRGKQMATFFLGE